MSGRVHGRRRWPVARVLLLAIAALWAGCSQHQDPTAPVDEPPESEAPVVEIQLQNFRFSQQEVRIAPGTVVRWRNTTSSFHTVTPDGHATWTEWQTAGEGQTFEVRFDQAGTYPYYCSPHQGLGLTGRIIVESPSE